MEYGGVQVLTLALFRRSSTVRASMIAGFLTIPTPLAHNFEGREKIAVSLEHDMEDLVRIQRLPLYDIKTKPVGYWVKKKSLTSPE